MAFDLKSFREAHRPWTFAIGEGRRRRVFSSRHVSGPCVLRYLDMWTEAKGNGRSLKRALYYLLRMAFPWRPSYMLRGDPVKIILNLEQQARAAALQDFFVSLGLEVTTTPPSKTTTTSSPRSFGRTAARA